MIYNSLFKSHIEYNLICWGKANNYINRIIVLQKRSIRYIAKLKYNSHTGETFKKFNILRFNDLVSLNQACFMYKYVNEKLPSSFQHLFKKLNNFERSLAFELPRVNKLSSKLLPSFAMIKYWNEIPLELRRQKTLKSFKRYFSNSLLENYNTECSERNCYSCR